MLAEANGVNKIILTVGYTDLRRSIDGLAQIIGTKYDLNPFEAGVLFLFCGRRTDLIKGLLWEGDGFLFVNWYNNEHRYSEIKLCDTRYRHARIY